MTEEAELIRSFQRGESGAFDRLYTEHGGRILAFALRLTGNREDAEDITQETFVAAFRGRERFNASLAILPWLLGVTARRWRDRNRKHRIAAEPLQELVVSDGLTAICGASGDRLETAILLEDAILALPEGLRECFLLVASQGLTHREAALALGCGLGAVKWRVAEATRRLRASLSDLDQTEVTHVHPLSR